MRLKLPDGAFEAYLFDCDGTIVDSMPLHYLAWKKALGHLYMSRLWKVCVPEWENHPLEKLSPLSGVEFGRK